MNPEQEFLSRLSKKEAYQRSQVYPLLTIQRALEGPQGEVLLHRLREAFEVFRREYEQRPQYISYAILFAYHEFWRALWKDFPKGCAGAALAGALRDSGEVELLFSEVCKDWSITFMDRKESGQGDLF